MGNIHFSITNYLPEPLSSTCPRISVRVSSHVVGSCSVLLMTLSLAPTRPTVVADAHTVSVCPAVSYHVSNVFPVCPLGICLALPIQGHAGPLLYPVVSCWSFWVKVATVLVRSATVLHCNIIVSISDTAVVSRLMGALFVPSIS